MGTFLPFFDHFQCITTVRHQRCCLWRYCFFFRYFDELFVVVAWQLSWHYPLPSATASFCIFCQATRSCRSRYLRYVPVLGTFYKWTDHGHPPSPKFVDKLWSALTQSTVHTYEMLIRQAPPVLDLYVFRMTNSLAYVVCMCGTAFESVEPNT